MPRQSKPARLWLRPAGTDRAAVWIILDRGGQFSTGLGAAARTEAEQRLAEHIAAKRQPAGERHRHPDKVLIADVISVYIDEVVPGQANPAAAGKRAARLLEWWGTKRLAAVSPASCLAYIAHREAVERGRREAGAAKRKSAAPPKPVKGGGARRDLEDLRAAIHHHAERELHLGLIDVYLPPRSGARTRFLTRDEAAKLLWTCWRHGRAVRLPKGRNKGATVESAFHDLRHLARFILLGLYTGSRSGAILSASVRAGADRSFVDLDTGIFFRRADGTAETSKRQPPAPLPPRLLAHLRRWERKKIIADHVVEWQGAPVASVKTAWQHAVRLAGLDPGVTPHTLRHTAATWLMQNGVSIWTAAHYLGMSEEMIRRVYGHLHPDYLQEAAAGITRKPKRQSLPKSLPQPRPATDR